MTDRTQSALPRTGARPAADRPRRRQPDAAPASALQADAAPASAPRPDAEAAPSPAGTAPAGTPRLGWLDALRGFAAATVMCFHLSPYVLGPDVHRAIGRHIDLGKYGVLLFFLVSGYVIPMSLERHGSLRRFWVGRIFRIYPAFLAAAALMGLFVVAGVLPLTPSLRAEPLAGLLGHATMLQEPLGLRGIVRVFWTLSYEMMFYLLVAGLFALRLHRRSTWWAGALALGAVVLGGVLPDGLLTPDAWSRRLVAALLLVAVVGSVAAYLSGRRRAVRVAGLLGVGFVALPALNGSPAAASTVIASWQALLLLAVMFAGTVIYHAQHGIVSRRAAATALVTVGAGVLLGHWIHLPAEVSSAAGLAVQRAVWVGTTLAVAATFALAFALRRRRVPRALAWLGAVSYSVYVLHVIVFLLFVNELPNADTRPVAARLAIAAAFFAVVLVAAGLSYRFVERPAQRLGRLVDAWLAARLGPEQARLGREQARGGPDQARHGRAPVRPRPPDRRAAPVSPPADVAGAGSAGRQRGVPGRRTH